ncbi:MAG: phosphoenolpyruvate carboxykinase (ATP) [Deltaproteobacteria bacterium RIFCSPLOWO2_12_FULL_40_28]|nr:MAG: phosphoenolpyruvate carboxykinase (ATP) [Deltaproteobacteria bacterium RIFCSPHIGHO2_02_FULL_40_28]OGQ18803.1 MAG: phosphoenolpyruvate carboxykinase (ATP) [Deltaproteobacteria bacterium RIFCSPHIGHO2_12_FULL_40_32]OGQ40048.1 MAG: phosphoenolpyruvate carboxykinase (ATP) [Deltaproteobacteria bacterium RIFCSPLOWO2_02_FULL_40_36]OGQ53231.1 MAG: phosphoenolpyruvate carboxykinase (ATP) [Deltaproteobacteria bacterium RIFCSPLOWO2_12_FULL_40_28]
MLNQEVIKFFSLEKQGILGVKKVYWNLSVPSLYEEAIKRGEAKLAACGPLLCDTGKYTGRSPNDKFIVKDGASENKIWWGKVNISIEPSQFDVLYKKVLEHLKGKEVFVQDCYAGADPDFCLPIRVITEFAWQSLFAQNMFVRIKDQKILEQHVPEYTLIAVPTLKAEPASDGTCSEAFIIPNFSKKIIIIGGTHYAGEIKKSIFTLLNYILPQKGVLSMHCSANMGTKKDTAVFFGLSGTGKTTLSADPERFLIGDDEHGWSDNGVFNFEGGCYAKAIKLNPKAEPEIYATTRRFGTVLENVVYDEKERTVDLDSAEKTENTRASYPIDFIPNVVENGLGGHPQNVIMLTCDAFGVLPPVARLTPAQAMYHFLSGYTAKVAGTERGIKEPQATFSACFGAPFMALHPGVYAKLLGEKIAKHQVTCWLVNTGWSGGSYGVGERFAIKDSRSIIKAILSGDLNRMSFKKDAIFGFETPLNCPGVSSSEILEAKNTWKDKAGYDAKACELARLFNENFKQFAEGTSIEIRNAAPIA